MAVAQSEWIIACLSSKFAATPPGRTTAIERPPASAPTLRAFQLEGSAPWEPIGPATSAGPTFLLQGLRAVGTNWPGGKRRPYIFDGGLRAVGTNWPGDKRRPYIFAGGLRAVGTSSPPAPPGHGGHGGPPSNGSRRDAARLRPCESAAAAPCFGYGNHLQAAHSAYPLMYGFVSRSTPISVSGPCPGYTIVSSGSE